MFDGLERCTFGPGVQVFNDGDAGSCAYLIEEGRVEVTTFRKEKPHKMGILGKGDIFGEMALIDKRPRTASVIALEHTRVVKITRDLLNAKLAKTDPVIEHLLRLVLLRYRSTHAMFTGNEYSNDQSDVKSDAAILQTQQGLIEQIKIASDIAEALKRNEFILYYQPIFSIRDNQLAGYEALIRWRHPKRGIVPPAKFLNIAEQTGQILDIGVWTLRQACHDYKILSKRQEKNAEQLFISVNLSARQLLKAKDTAQFAHILHEANVDPSCIKLEITETVLLEDPDYAEKVLSALKDIGFQLSLDDFGTGYSSLSHLQQFPVDYIKIDQSFVKTMSQSNESKQIVKASIGLANTMGKQAIAEGIESNTDVCELNKMECAFGQGYYYSKPLSLDDAIAYMDAC